MRRNGQSWLIKAIISVSPPARAESLEVLAKIVIENTHGSFEMVES